MPGRRGSSAAGHSSQTPASSVNSRTFRSQDSHPHLPSQSSQPSMTFTGHANPQQKVVQTLINRLKNKLPCLSGISLDRLEADPAVQQVIKTLVDLSVDCLDFIAWSLSDVLDKLQTQMNHVEPTRVPDLLQSQLMILKILSITMASRWSDPRQQSDPTSREASLAPDSPVPPPYLPHNVPGSDHRSSPSLWSEPPPIESNIAKYILHVLVTFLAPSSYQPNGAPCSDFSTVEMVFWEYQQLDLHQSSAYLAARRATSTLTGDTRVNPNTGRSSPTPILRNRHSANSINSSLPSVASSYVPSAYVNTAYENTHMSLVNDIHILNKLVVKFAGRIIHYLSVANWKVVFSKVRSRIHQLADNERKEPPPDSPDLFIMAHCALDRVKLIQVLNELSSLLVNLKHHHLLQVMQPLRLAIWKWIETFPHEFNDVMHGRSRLDGAPERLFDQLYSVVQPGRERDIWPTLMALNCVAPERISADFGLSGAGGDGRAKPYGRKDMKFGEDILKHCNSATKLTETAIQCALDLCRAAARVVVEDETEVAICEIAGDVAHEIKVGLWSNQMKKPFWESDEPIDVTMFSEVLVAVYRFLPPDEGLALFALCLDPERSEAVKTCAVRACLILSLEAEQFPWTRSTEVLHGPIGLRITSVFSSIVSSRHELDRFGSVKKPQPRPRSRPNGSANQASDRDMLLLVTLALWRADPSLYFHSLGARDIKMAITSLSRIFTSPTDVTVKLSTAYTVRIAVEVIATLKPGDALWDVGTEWLNSAIPPTMAAIASTLIVARTDTEQQRLWTNVLQHFLKIYMTKREAQHMKKFQIDARRVPAFAMSEIAFMISLTSSDTAVCQAAAQGLRALAHAQRAPDAPVNPGITEEDRSKRNPAFEQLGDSKVAVVGRVGYQKYIRKLMRLIAYPCASHVAVWQECYWRWRSLSETIIESMAEYGAEDAQAYRAAMTADLQEKHNQWKNLTLFLAAFGGASLIEDGTRPSLTDSIPPEFMPDDLRVLQNPTNLVVTFLTDLTNLLVAEYVEVREVARDALGTELSPRLFPKLLGHLTTVVATITQGAGSEFADTYVLFLDQFIALLRLLIENLNLNFEINDIDWNATLAALAIFITRFEFPGATRIKIKFCQLCETVYTRLRAVAVTQARKETLSRNTVVDYLVEWARDPNFSGDKESVMLQNELNVTCLRTCSMLLEKMQLQPLDGSSGDDTGHIVSRMFIKYSTALLKMLELSQLDVLTSDSASDVPTLQHRMRVSYKEAEVRDFVISGLAHLVTANSELGFRHCLPLAYDPDPRKKMIHAYVFARVLGQGTNLEPLAEPAVVQSPHTRLKELVKSPDLVVALAICETCPPSEMDITISALLNIFDTRASLMRLIKLLINREIESTETEASLFRGNSICTRFLSAFARIHGYNYLRNLILPLVKIMSSTPGQGYELDPSKAGAQDVANNQQHVEVVATSFLNILFSSIPTLPSMFREICAHIAQSVVEVWPEAKFAALGAFIFLRFISPAVVAPETVDIEISPEDAIPMRRGLMVITKIIQNLANNIFFGKEQHMMCLNKFLEDNIVNVTKYLSELNKYSENTSENENDDEWLGGIPDETDALVLHRYFEKHADKIGKELLSHSKAATETENMSVPGKKAWDQLCALLVDLGQSPELPRFSTLTIPQHAAYRELMTRCAHRNIAEIAHLLVEGPTKPDEPVLLIWRFAQSDEVFEADVIMSHFFRVVTAPGNEKRTFQVVADCTLFTAASEIPVQWWRTLAELMPVEVQQRWLTTYILNANFLAQKYFRRIFNLSSNGSPFPSETRTCSSVSELATFVSPASLEPMRYAAALESEPKEIYIDVLKRYHAYLPITLEVGTTHVRMTSAKAQPIAAALTCRTVDIVLLTDISDVYNVSTGQEPNEFVIRRSRQGITLYFSSILRDSIVKNIRATKALLKEHRPPLSERFARFSNGPASLLHVGMLHMETDSEELRTASYALLGSVCSYLGLNANDCPVVAETTGFVPKDVTSFVVELSTSLARLAPHLTLDFISEVAAGLSGLDCNAIAQKTNCLRYLAPWIMNLQVYTNPTNPLYERSGARLRDCIRVLVEMVVIEYELSSIMQACIWTEVSKLDSATVNVVLDEIVRMAIDGTLGTRRWESLARVVSTLSSINIRGRLLSRLRKSLGKASPKAHRSLEHTPHWNELATIIRLVYISGPVPGNNGLYLPELFHVVVLLAGTGITLVRKSVYGIVINFLQALYLEHPGTDLSSEVMALLGEMEEEKTLMLFGLERPKPTSEYADYDAKIEKVAIDGYGDLTRLLLRILEVASGSQGLLNVWRARWMSLVASTAFQISPAIQARAFIVLGELATSDVDDDFLYQMLVAFKTSLSQSKEADTTAIVSMLRCMCRIVPALSDGARYLCPLFWLAVALIQSSHIAFYVEATQLLEKTLIAMEAKGILAGLDTNDMLLGGRSGLEDVAIQLDSLLGISFTSDFSFSLAAVIFKGIRHTGLRESAESVLRTLLRITVQGRTGQGVPRNALGYFIALLPVSTTATSFQQLLSNAGVLEPINEELMDDGNTDSAVPVVPLVLLGLEHPETPLLVASFIGSILSSAQGDDSETQMLCSLLAEMVSFYPDTIALTYELYQDRIKDCFANSSNPSIIRATSVIFRVALQDVGARTGSSLRGSASTLNTVDESASNTPGRLHLSALEDLNLHGLASSFQFLPPNRGVELLHWIPELVSRIID